MADTPAAAPAPVAPAETNQPTQPTPPSKPIPDGKPANEDVEAADEELSAFESLIEKFTPEKREKARAKLLAKAPIKIKRGEKEELFGDIDKLSQLAGRGYGANETLAEAKALKAQAEQDRALLSDLTSKDPQARRRAADYLAQRSPAVQEAFEERILETIKRQEEDSGLSPEARKYKQLVEQQNQKLEYYARQEQELIRARQEELRKQQEAQAEQRLSSLAIAALQKAGFPEGVNPYYFRRLAPMMQEALETGIEVTPDGLAGALRSHIEEELHGTLGQLQGERIIQFLGPELMKRIRIADLAQLKASNAPLRPQPTGMQSSPRRNGQENLDPWQLIREIEKGG